MSLSSPLLPHSCIHCEKLVLDLESVSEQIRNRANYTGLDEARLVSQIRGWSERLFGTSHRHQEVTIFDITLAAAREAAEEGCLFCVFLLKAPESSANSAQLESVIFVANISGDSVLFGFLDLNELEKYNGPNSVFRISSEYSFSISAMAENVAAKDFSTRPINSNPGSLSSLQLAKDWLQTCLKDHKACEKLSMKYIPTRLIEIICVNKRSCLRLIETTSATNGSYAVLSYCWGKENHVITTSGSMRRHLVRINKQDLPKTLQDAVHVTESLGLRYLWVDSLCIIQDDDNDKALEVAQMPLVYSQAVITITASRASQVQEGFLQARRHPNAAHPELMFQLPYRCRNGDLGSVIISPAVRESIEPLDRRAWALQERFMSPRMLDYGSINTRWTCPQIEGYKSIADGFKANSVYNETRSDSTFSSARRLVLADAMGLELGNESLDTIHGMWWSLLEVYSHRILSEPTDRLLAFSGIATRFAQRLKDDYVAGLWGSRLLCGELFWTADRTRQPRPSKYQDPSWSWAGINGPVRFSRHRSEQLSEYFKVIEYQVQLSDKAGMLAVNPPKYGAINAGILKVQGLLRPAIWTPDQRKWNETQSQVLKTQILDGQDEVLAARVEADAIEHEFNGRGLDSLAVFLLIVNTEGRSTLQTFRGLILRRRGESEYSRVGVFRTNAYSLPAMPNDKLGHQNQAAQRQIQWFLDNDPQVIKIV